MSNRNNVGTYTRTITTTPDTAELLNYLVDKYVLPGLQKRVAQGSMKRNLPPEKEIENILRFTGLRK